MGQIGWGSSAEEEHAAHARGDDAGQGLDLAVEGGDGDLRRFDSFGG